MYFLSKFLKNLLLWIAGILIDSLSLNKALFCVKAVNRIIADITYTVPFISFICGVVVWYGLALLVKDNGERSFYFPFLLLKHLPPSSPLLPRYHSYPFLWEKMYT